VRRGDTHFDQQLLDQIAPREACAINGDAGAASTVDLDWSATGPPTKATTDTLTAGAAAPDYNSMTVADLQQLAGERGLPTSGTKADLVARLVDADAAAAPAA